MMNGSHGSSSGGSSSSSGGGQQAYPSTPLIETYLARISGSENLTVISAITGCEGQFGQSAAVIPCDVDAKQAAVQIFLTDAVSYVGTIAKSEAIDTQTIDGVLATFQTQDLDWFSTTFADFTPQQLAPYQTSYPATVNSLYADAITEIDAM